MVKKIKKVTDQELVEILKFTPRTYSISMSGYGGEIAMGVVDPETYDYIKSNNINISEMICDDDNELDIPEEHRFLINGWYDCDNIAHESGVSFSDGSYVIVTDENGNDVWECSLDSEALHSAGCTVYMHEQLNIEDYPGKIVYLGECTEKGTFFGGTFELKTPFSPSKLGFSYGTYEGSSIGNSITYNDDDIDNNDYSTTGKGDSYEIYEVSSDLEVTKYVPDEGELNGGLGYSNYYAEDDEKVTFYFKNHKPHYVGWYECRWVSWSSSTFGKLYWDGTRFVEFYYNKPTEVSGVDTWTGVNWDTSDLTTA